MRRSALLTTTIASFLTPFAASSVNIALPAIAKEFSMDAITLNWVTTSYLLSIAVFLLPSGRMADMRGRKK
ncbi:MAG: MFS transporter, partial [Archaeoglobi archaeon]|nr:MFS transporter [Candidatus Mnemosynella bozhongmuii]